MKLKNKLPLLLLLFPVLLSGTRAFPQVNIPAKPSNYVTDLAGIISPETKAKLDSYLAYFERATTAQVFVLTIESLKGESLDELSIHVAHDMWKIGQKGKDNGVLLLVSVQERKIRLEIGYGLEGVLTDALSRRIINQDMDPYFRKGDYSDGIVSAVVTVTRTIAASEGIELGGGTAPVVAQTAPRRESRGGASTLTQKIFSVLLIIAAIFLFIKYPRLFILLLLMSGGGRRGGWGGGGGFSGGGGGFSGGGGGGFGGGGASGGW